MVFAKPQYSKSKVNRAGDILVSPDAYSAADQRSATLILANWRACHGYPINTFQATLRHKLRAGYGQTIVAQRLKRAPSIIAKLERFEGMQLARMQDIGGLRAVVSSVTRVRRLEKEYRDTVFEHRLVSSKNYIDEPKEDGYRSVHLIYRYANSRVQDYNGLSLELQLRTQLQHAWATAVETMGTFLGQALKSGEGEGRWREFFSKASAALAIIEHTAPIPGFEGLDRKQVFEDVARTERELRVLDKLKSFAIAAEHITAEMGQGAYHLIVLDSGQRTVAIHPYAIARLDEAITAYTNVEQRTRAGEPVEAVLVSAGPIGALRKAFPNYFLDTQVFLRSMRSVIAEVSPRRPRKRVRRVIRRRR